MAACALAWALLLTLRQQLRGWLLRRKLRLRMQRAKSTMSWSLCATVSLPAAVHGFETGGPPGSGASFSMQWVLLVE